MVFHVSIFDCNAGIVAVGEEEEEKKEKNGAAAENRYQRHRRKDSERLGKKIGVNLFYLFLIYIGF